jgi:hypothetical protein
MAAGQPPGPGQPSAPLAGMSRKLGIVRMLERLQLRL